jgi:methylation protein EvaC
MAQCLICNARVEPFMSFGRMPIANGFLHSAEFEREIFFELKVGHCHYCHLVQLTELLDPQQLFHEEYAYFSSISVRMASHFAEFADQVKTRHLGGADPFVVEIGSNDGILLQNFARERIRHLGVEPSANVAEAAIKKGVCTISRFFDGEAAEELRAEHGQADVILGANVICHLPNLHSVMRGVATLLKDDGVFIFEEPYLADIIARTAYDQIYDEHVSYFSLHSLGFLFAMYDMKIIDVMGQNVHGGSMRYVVARQGRKSVQPVVEKQLDLEEAIGLRVADTYQRFSDKVQQSRERLVDLLNQLKRQGKRVVGYGATSKSTTVTNYCRIGPDLIEYISDTTPGKQGKYNPGTHIPVVPYERFRESYPDYALLFAWNHGEEILEKEKAFENLGGRFITYVPSVQTLA